VDPQGVFTPNGFRVGEGRKEQASGNNPGPSYLVERSITTQSNLRLALRGLRRAPLFAAVAILSLALGIGANAAIFTLLDQLLLRRLPVKSPDQLVMVYQDAANMGSNSGSRMFGR
jgi:hypothetical protein